MFLTFLLSLISLLIFIVVLYYLGILVVLIYIKLRLEWVKAVCVSNTRLDNKIVLVTGGNQGIGRETARDLAARGARVIIACRDRGKSAEAIADIVETTGNNNIEYRYLDLASFKCVRKFAEDFSQAYEKLDILINNAGCAGRYRVTEDGLDMVMQVNYLGPFLLTNLLLDKIKASTNGRIIVVSSILHFIGRVTSDQLDGLQTICPFFRYSNSKLCEILWMKALAKRLPSHVTANSLHPGAVKTDLFNAFRYISQKWVKFLLHVLNFKTPKEGAQTTIYLAVSEEVANVSGKYFMECKEADYRKIADNDEFVEKIWNRSVMLTN